MMQFGTDEKYTLDERALRHIVDGEFTKRLHTDAAGNRSASDVLSGGLHTWGAWESFMKNRPGFVHLADFDPNLHKGWYFGRELQNGVIALRIPRELFSGDAASITMQPDLHFKSGYLWKTLFPQSFTQGDIVQVIEEALANVSAAESEISEGASIKIGYARLTDPFTAIRIRVQLQGNEIRSAFPSWDQPSTGNNGKPYSPEQSIMLSLAASTVGVTNQSIRTSRLFKRTGKFELQELIGMTPTFLLKRSFPVYGAVSDEWRKVRIEEIRRFAETCSTAGIEKALGYLVDFCLSKEPFLVQTELKRSGTATLLANCGLANVAMIMQNVSDCYVLLAQTDNRTGGRKFIDCAVRFLAMAVIHTGFLNLFEYKRLLKLIIQCASGHHVSDAVKIILESISDSPIRAALYCEVNINPYFKTNDTSGFSVIGHNQLTVPVTTGLLYDWAATNLGENYLVTFSKTQRLKIAESFVKQNTDEEFVEQSLRYFTGTDFDFFCETLTELPTLLASRDLPSEASMINLIREYDRMLLTYRQRIVLEDLDSYDAVVDYDLAGTADFFDLIKQKHKRQYVIANHERAMNAMEQFATAANYPKLEKRVNNLRRKLGKERIPIPVPVPLHLRKWKLEQENGHGLDAFVADPLFIRSGK